MYSLLHACCYTVLPRARNSAVKTAISGFSITLLNRCIKNTGIRFADSDFFLTRLRVQCYSTKRASKKKEPDTETAMKDDREAFFVVRKGDIVGVYKSLSDCQAQVGSSISDPPVSVYKGNGMRKDAEKYLLSFGLRNALYTLKAEDLTEGLFGTLVACPYQIPSSSGGETSNEHIPRKRSHEEAMYMAEGRSCTLEFDGASKGNPGQAGAGVVLRADDGSLIWKIREGLGVATCNAAEYRAIILGLKYALQKGFTSIRVRGDSKLVCMQIQGLWKVKNQNISILYEEAKKLKESFLSFHIMHVLRVILSFTLFPVFFFMLLWSINDARILMFDNASHVRYISVAANGYIVYSTCQGRISGFLKAGHRSLICISIARISKNEEPLLIIEEKPSEN